MTTTRPVRRPPRVAGTPPRTTRARFAARARSARWRHRRPLLIGALVLVLLAGLGAFLYLGPALVVRDVRISGVSAPRAIEVRAAVAAPMHRPLAQVDTGAMAQRVRALPFVAAVTVSRHWPSTLQVSIDARTPAATVPDPAGGYRIVDPSGVAFASATAPIPGIPVVKVQLTQDGRPALQAALAVLAALPAPVRSTVGVVTAGSPDDVRLTVGKATLVWGSAQRSERKAAIYAILRKTPARVYDLSSPDTPVLR